MKRALSRYIGLFPLVGILSTLFAYPLFYGVFLSLIDREGKFTFENYLKFFGNPSHSETIFVSLKIGLTVASLSTVLGIIIAVALVGSVSKAKGSVERLVLLPMTMGTLMGIQGTVGVLGDTGWLNRFLRDLGLRKEPIQFLYTDFAVIILLSIGATSFAYLMLSGILRGMDPNIKVAALSLGANPWRVFWTITFPLIFPGVLTVFVFNFVGAFGVYTTALVLGNPAKQTMAILAYDFAFRMNDWNMACAVSVVMIAIETVILAILFRMMRWRQPV